jgi:hypothetical protein
MAATSPAKKAAKKAAPAKRTAASQLLPGLVPDTTAADPDETAEQDTAAAAEEVEFDGFDLDTLDKKSVLPDVTDIPFEFKLDGHVYTMQDPRDVDWKNVLDGLGNPILFMRLALDDPQEADRFIQVKLPGWKLSALFENWQRHYGVADLVDLNKLLSARTRPSA